MLKPRFSIPEDGFGAKALDDSAQIGVLDSVMGQTEEALPARLTE